MARAKAKVRHAARHAESTPLAQEQVDKMPVRQGRDNPKSDVPSRDLRVLIEESLTRTYSEIFKSEHAEMWADEASTMVLRQVLYGIPDPGFGHGTKVKEVEMNAPECKSC